jgi:hypothetical protein
MLLGSQGVMPYYQDYYATLNSGKIVYPYFPSQIMFSNYKMKLVENTQTTQLKP